MKWITCNVNEILLMLRLFWHFITEYALGGNGNRKEVVTLVIGQAEFLAWAAFINASLLML